MVDFLGGASLPLLLVVAGVVISILEAVAPGAHFIVLGVSLLVAGLVGLLFPPVAGPLALAALVLAVGAAALWGYRNLDIYGGSGTSRTSDSGSLAGREGVVTERVTQTGGRVRLYDGGFDPTFSARSFDEPIAEETEIIVVDPGGGSVLTVAALDRADDDSIDRALARERARSATEGEDGTEAEPDPDPDPGAEAGSEPGA